MKTPIPILVAVFLVGCEPSTVEQPTPQAASIQPISQPAPPVETVYGKPIVDQFDANVVAITDGDTIKVFRTTLYDMFKKTASCFILPVILAGALIDDKLRSIAVRWMSPASS